jgi:hypothetical protein
MRCIINKKENHLFSISYSSKAILINDTYFHYFFNDDNHINFWIDDSEHEQVTFNHSESIVFNYYPNRI